MTRLIVTAIFTAALAASPALAQKKDPANTTTTLMEQKRQQEMEAWRQKGEQSSAAQTALRAKRKDCNAKAKAQKLSVMKRRKFVKDCMA